MPSGWTELETGVRPPRQEVQHEVLGRGRQPTVDVGNRDAGTSAVFGTTESYTEHVATGREMWMRRKSGVFILQLDPHPSTKTSRSVTVSHPANEDEPGEPGFRWQAFQGSHCGFAHFGRQGPVTVVPQSSNVGHLGGQNEHIIKCFC